MPYTPPAGNAVYFNFLGNYTALVGSSVNFDFGSGVIPPSSLALPTGANQARREEEEWTPPPRRRIRYVPTVPAAALVPWRRFAMPRELFEDDDWQPQRRRMFAPIVTSTTYTARVMLFITT